MKLKYRPEIDGLRAIAVIPVILFHVGFKAFSGGYSGVDVFFVISGYLITSIIYSESNENKFSLINFYERRARRILPLLFCLLFISIPFAWISLYQMDIIDYFQSLIAVPLFSSNFLFVNEANYFDTSTDLKPLLHTWSLAVEEQFYLFFPLFIMFFFRFFRKQRLLLTLTIISIISFILAEWASITHPIHNFYLLPTRIWELAAGALLAILLINKNSLILRIKNQKRLREILGLIGLALISSGMFIIKKETPFPSYYTLFPVIGTVLIIAFSRKDCITGIILSSKPLVFIGLISYSAYLWHHPIFAFAKHLSFPVNTFTGKSVLSLIVFPLSFLSWKFIENPFRNKKKFKRKFIFSFSIIGSLFFIIVGVIGVLNDGFPNRSINQRLQIHNYYPDNRKLKLDSWVKLNETKDALKDQSWFENENPLPNMLLIGNSHSKDLYNVLKASRVANTNYELGQVTLQVSEFENTNHSFFDTQNYINADIIIIVSKYYYEDQPYIAPLVERLLKDSKKTVIVREIHNFEEFHSKTKADLIVEEYIRKGLDLENINILNNLVEDVNEAYYIDYVSQRSNRELENDKVIDDIKTMYSKLIVLDKMGFVRDNDHNLCFAINSKLEKYFYDYGHFTVDGTVFFGKRVDEVNWLAPLMKDNLDD